MPRFFRLEQARALLPKVAESLKQAMHMKREHERADQELQSILHKVAVVGGMVVDRDKLLGQRARRDAIAMRLKEVIEEIHSTGCQVKDLDMGLIDFPALYKGDEVCLCWKMGEDAIDYWHGATEGYRGRRPIDSEFLENHRGD